ncbi:MAG: hydroxymethylbilane synthase [Proteobacteria bacterium]|nr:hydroxymethylbilane synthase [Pseudomonadota bacterium]
MAASALRIGTRGSKLALVQAREAAQRLALCHGWLAAPGAIEIVPIRTTGDAQQTRLLAEIGGKGLFTKEIDEALLGGRIELAVHSLKDLPTWLPDGVLLAAVLEREDPRDVFIARGAHRLAELPRGASVGSASLRRAAQLLHRRPDLKIVPLRGNVDTRIAKIAAGEADATLLALAGLKRLGLMDRVGSIMETDEMLPAVGQAAIGITARADDTRTRSLLAAIDHRESALRITAERAMLAVLDGSCRTPIAGLAELSSEGALRLQGLVALPDGSELVRSTASGAADAAVAIGQALGAELRSRAGAKFFAAA